MTITTQAPAAARTPDGEPGACRYPGCANPARARDRDAPGRRPGYCGQEVAEDRGDGTAGLGPHTPPTPLRPPAPPPRPPGPHPPGTPPPRRAGGIRDQPGAPVDRPR